MKESLCLLKITIRPREIYYNSILLYCKHANTITSYILINIYVTINSLLLLHSQSMTSSRRGGGGFLSCSMTLSLPLLAAALCSRLSFTACVSFCVKLLDLPVSVLVGVETSNGSAWLWGGSFFLDVSSTYQSIFSSD